MFQQKSRTTKKILNYRYSNRVELHHKQGFWILWLIVHTYEKRQIWMATAHFSHYCCFIHDAFISICVKSCRFHSHFSCTKKHFHTLFLSGKSIRGIPIGHSWWVWPGDEAMGFPAQLLFESGGVQFRDFELLVKNRKTIISVASFPESWAEAWERAGYNAVDPQ